MRAPSPATSAASPSEHTFPLLGKLDDLRHDLPTKIHDHPWAALGIALGLGALTAWTRKPRRGLGGLVTAGLGALAARLVKDALLGEVLGATKHWFDVGRGATESRASRMREVEPFLEH